MKAEQLSKNVLDLDPLIRFAGVMEKSGHLYAGSQREGMEEHLKGRNSEISYAQSAYIVDLRKMFTSELGKLKTVVYIYDKVTLINFPLKDHLLVVSSEDRKSTRLNSSHANISYAVFCLKKKK